MVYNDLDVVNKNDEQQQGGSQQSQVQPVSGVGIASQSSGPQSQQSANQSEPKKNTSKFTNVQRYVDANKGAANKLGQGIQNKISDEASSVREGIQSVQNQFQQQAGQTQYNLNKATGYAQQVGQAGGAQQIADTQSDFENFRNIYTGQVKAPTETMSNQTNQLNKLQELARLSGTESGRFDLLNQTYASPTGDYSLGEKRLDQLILQGTPEAARSLQQFSQQQERDLSNEFTQAQKDQTQRQQELGTLATEQQKLLDTSLGAVDQEALVEAQRRVNSELQNYGDTIDSNVTQQQWEQMVAENPSLGRGALGDLYKTLYMNQGDSVVKQIQDYNKAQNALKEYDPTGTPNPDVVGAQVQNPRYLSQEELDILNLDPNLRTYGMDLNPFADTLQLGDRSITMADVANQEQQSRLNALYRLAGQDTSSINLGEQADQAGALLSDDFEAARQNAMNDLINNANLGTFNISGYNGRNVYFDPSTGQLSAFSGSIPGLTYLYDNQISPLKQQLDAAIRGGGDYSQLADQYQQALDNYQHYIGNDLYSTLRNPDKVINSLYKFEAIRAQDALRPAIQNIVDRLNLGNYTLGNPGDDENS